MKIRVAVIEDHPLMRKAVVNELKPHPDIEIIRETDRGSELMAVAREYSPDVIILDLGMADDDAFEPISSVKALFQNHPNIRLIILTGYNDRLYIQHLIKAGVLGYILKNDDFSLSLAQAVRTVYRGERFYSPGVLKQLFADESVQFLHSQEIAVLRLVAEGYSNETIGDMLSLSEKRIRNILTQVYLKLDVHENQGVNTRVAVINKARQLGLLQQKSL
jgi:DNA-binding NarL/FixJ family response regulator